MEPYQLPTEYLFNQTFSTSNPDYLLLDAALFYMTNEERSKIGVASMPYHKLLEVAAYNHSLKMATTGFFSHSNSVDASRASTSDRGKLAGVANPSFAENIAYNYPSSGNTYMQVAFKLMDQWMNSPGHKSNILSTNGRQLGCGTYYFNGKIYGTQVFQWFSDVAPSANGGVDQLPGVKPRGTTNTQPTVTSNPNPSSNTNSNTNTQPQVTKTTTNSQGSNNGGSVVLPAKKKKRTSTSEMLSLRVGIHGSYPLGDVNELNTEFSAEALSWHASAMVGYRFGKSSYKKSVAGVFLNFGQYSDKAAEHISGIAVGSPYFEIEAGVLIRDHVRISVGQGSDNLATGNGDLSRNYTSGTLGYSFGKKNVKVELNNTIIIPADTDNIELRPSLGLVYRLNFLK